MSDVADVKGLESALEQARDVLATEPSLIELPSRPIIFVGDTHGDIRTTEKVLDRFLGSHLVVFLGDYVDRAPKDGSSTHNLWRILQEKVQHPQDIVLLRGNHEFSEAWRYGMRQSLTFRNWDHLLPKISETLSQLPYATRTENGVFAVHGGIPNVVSLDEIKEIPKGVTSYFQNKLASQCTWNDNLLQGGIQDGYRNWAVNTERGFGDDFAIIYGQNYLDEKLAGFGAKVLVRGHDYHAKGYSLSDRVLTIFTAKQYAKDGNLKGAYVASLDPNKTIDSAKDLDIIHIN